MSARETRSNETPLPGLINIKVIIFHSHRWQISCSSRGSHASHASKGREKAEPEEGKRSSSEMLAIPGLRRRLRSARAEVAIVN